ncbi:MAG: hypothetical protein LLG04_13260 [Parachlamydia sp.]|nr:hypothetical protein [Parachlamydia sp.]
MVYINKQEWQPAHDLQPPVRLTTLTAEQLKRKSMLREDLNFLQAFDISEKSNTSLTTISISAKPLKSEILPEKEAPSGLVTWAKHHPWQAGASAIAAVALGTALGTAAAYGVQTFAAVGAQAVKTPQILARPLELPKEWLERAALPTCSLNPPFNVGTTPAPVIVTMDLPICPAKMCPIPNPYEWSQIATVEKAANRATNSAFDTLKWVGTGAAIVSLAAATAPLVVPIAAGGAAIAAVGTAATAIGVAARSADAYKDIAAGNYGSAAFKVATLAAGPALGGIGTLFGKASETMTIAAGTFNDPARMQQLSGAGWKLVELGAKGADYLRNGGAVTNFLMAGGRFVLKR